MNITEFTNKYFDGDASEAICQLAKEAISREYTYTKSSKGLNEIIKHLNGAASDAYMEYYKYFAQKNSKHLHAKLNNASYRLFTRIELADTLNYETNPFATRLKASFLTAVALLLAFAASPLVTRRISESAAKGLNIAAIAVFAVVAVYLLFNLIRFHCFKKEKKTAEELKNVKFCPEIDSDCISYADKVELNGIVSGLPYEAVREPLDVETITKVLSLTNKTSRNTAMVFAVTLAVFAVLIAFGSLILTAILLILPVVCLFIYSKQKKSSKTIDNCKFHIVSDRCTNKKEIYDTEEETYCGSTLTFENHGNLRIDIGYGPQDYETYKIIKKTERRIEVGAECYLIILDGSSKIQFAFPKKNYKLKKSEFTATENGYVPTEKRIAEHTLLRRKSSSKQNNSPK